MRYRGYCWSGLLPLKAVSLVFSLGNRFQTISRVPLALIAEGSELQIQPGRTVGQEVMRTASP